jgi:predicted RNase H-like HicB family nuclease
MDTVEIIVKVDYNGNNFEAYLPDLNGCVATGQTLEEVKQRIAEAVHLHVQSSTEDNDPIPEQFKQDYKLIFCISVAALLNHYSEIFTKAALSRITGINERQLWFYAAGRRKPREEQRKRIEAGLRKLGNELADVNL